MSDPLSVVGHTLHLDGDMHGGNNGAQIRGDRLLGGDRGKGLLLDGVTQGVNCVVVGDNLARHLDVAGL